jgi:alanine-synthesizing transaminase
MFSHRTDWNRSSNRLTRLLEKRRRGGDRILDLTETNPTRVELPIPAAELLQSMADPASLVYEPDPSGSADARRAVSGVFSERGVKISPEDILLTASSSEAYAWLFKLLADPGDAVLVPRPSYPLFEYLTRLEGIELRPYALHWDGDWSLDCEALEKALDSSARAVVVVSPNNPTGTYLKEPELGALEQICSRWGVALIGDEVFAEYPHGTDPRRAASVLEAGPILSFSLGGLSKLCGLPQMKLGWIAVGGPHAVKKEARERLELVADTYLSVNTPVQKGAGALIEAGRAIREAIRQRIGGNLRFLREAVKGDSSCRVLPCEGGWMGVLQVPAVLSEEEWVLSLLSEDSVLVHPGYFFDFPAPAFLILSLLPPSLEFQEGVGRIVSRVAARLAVPG